MREKKQCRGLKFLRGCRQRESLALLMTVAVGYAFGHPLMLGVETVKAQIFKFILCFSCFDYDSWTSLDTGLHGFRTHKGDIHMSISLLVFSW